jgi:hypothetical protein
MMHILLRFFLLQLAFLTLLSPNLLYGLSLLDMLAIEVKGQSRPFVYTNKESAFLYGETGGDNTTGWQGFNVYGHEFLDDYMILVDGIPLHRSSALQTQVFPDMLVRYYPGGITEEVRMADSLALFAVTLHSPRRVDVDVIPYFTDGRTADEYDLVPAHESAFVARRAHHERTAESNYPVWLGIGGRGCTAAERDERHGHQFSPIRLHAEKDTIHTVGFAVADTRDEAEQLLKRYLQKPEWYDRARRARMEALLKSTRVQTGNPQFDKALAWAKLSLDALVMNQTGRGIFAGLPWFNNYWGRDTFISLPGATLVTGQFDRAREILRSFSEFQEHDSLSPNYGRIPNIVTTTDKGYNTADGTPRFVITAREYILRSGDEQFIREAYPAIHRTIDGTLRWHTDSMGFLSHGDAETWMDAVGPEGPWSPRGNRANDIQALWAHQLDAGIWFARLMKDTQSASLWSGHLTRLQSNFPRYFFQGDVLADHLRPDGSPAMEIRPNQIFASGLLTIDQRARILRRVCTEITYPYGVASLAPADPNFHPYHEYAPYYPKDAAYHNGTVWTWLQGPLISELCAFHQQETAFRLTEDAAWQILAEGAVGTQSELLDAIPRPGAKRPRPSGTISQAWNLAEFIRNVYDDYLGVHVDRLNNTLVLTPRLPRNLGRVEATVNANGQGIPIILDLFSRPQVVTIDGTSLRENGTAVVELPERDGKATKVIRFSLPAGAKVKVVGTSAGAEVLLDGKHHAASIERRSVVTPEALREPFTFARPTLPRDLKALRGPDYPLLPHSLITSRDSAARVVVLRSDPEGDDFGSGDVRSRGGSYSYPLNRAFVPGCLDLTHFGVRRSDSIAYFELRFHRLSNPGWHPEYGFQLTLAAIAIDVDGKSGTGKGRIEHNANYELNDSRGYERLVLIGGGVQVEDASGRILAAYTPEPRDEVRPFGDAETGVIRFALPLRLLGGLEGAHFTAVAGAQDDHGGAGIGEFRAVQREPGEWNGGGKTSDGESNIYDDLEIP